MQVPQVPPHPSGPHCRPAQLGWHTQVLLAVHVVGAEQVPHVPPHPSGPQALPVQFGRQRHCPLELHTSAPEQVPQVPPQPSGPQVRPAHCGTHRQTPASVHEVPLLHVPQLPPQPSLPHCLPSHDGVHPCINETRYASSFVASHATSGPLTGIVWSTSARWRMRGAYRSASPSVSKSTPTGAPARAAPVTVDAWHAPHRASRTARPSARGQSGLGDTLPVQAAPSNASTVRERRKALTERPDGLTPRMRSALRRTDLDLASYIHRQGVANSTAYRSRRPRGRCFQRRARRGAEAHSPNGETEISVGKELLGLCAGPRCPRRSPWWRPMAHRSVEDAEAAYGRLGRYGARALRLPSAEEAATACSDGPRIAARRSAGVGPRPARLPKT